jgi:hypothetical protein
MRITVLALGTMFTAACGLSVLADTDHPGIAQQILNPVGQLKGFKAGETERFVVWHGKGSWHIRTTTARNLHHFTGKIRVEGGTITTLEPHDLEFKGKFGDWWKLSENRKEIVVDFKTDRGVDGINFQVSPDAKLVHFNLHIDGKHRKNLIFVGRDGQHPEKDPFMLPAHP